MQPAQAEAVAVGRREGGTNCWPRAADTDEDWPSTAQGQLLGLAGKMTAALSAAGRNESISSP